MDLFASRSDDLDHIMVEECAARYVAKMNNKTECVRHLAFVASPHASVRDLSGLCDRVNADFTVQGARELCLGLNAVHAAFWPRFSR